ncbi:MAG: hypothetical protein IJP11_00955 [Oscillospiraceae bacterium]|nr:hypothetical protein [Oscillospiraceae bacterium]
MQKEFYPFPDKASSMQILQRDPCYFKIPADEVPAVFERAWNTGLKEANRFFSTVTPDDDFMTEALSARGITVKAFDSDYVVGNTRFFCEYLSEKNIVHVYRDAITVWAETNGFTYRDSLNLILAHEFFHHLEWHVIGLVSKQYLVPMLRIGRFSIGKTGIAALSEVAANAFANRIYLLGTQQGLFDPPVEAV